MKSDYMEKVVGLAVARNMLDQVQEQVALWEKNWCDAMGVIPVEEDGSGKSIDWVFCCGFFAALEEIEAAMSTLSQVAPKEAWKQIIKWVEREKQETKEQLDNMVE